MGVFDSIICEIKTILSEDNLLSDIIFTDIYNASAKPNPINNIYVGIGLNGVLISDKAFGEYFGIKDGNEIFGKGGNVSLKMKIYCPTKLSGEANCEVFSRLCNSLFASSIKNQITSISCFETTFDHNIGAFVMDCIVKLDVFIGNVNDDTPINNIVVKGVI